MQALRIQTEVTSGGELRLLLPGLIEGTPIEVIVLVGQSSQDVDRAVTEELSAAAEKTLDFWDNDIDDRIWNEA